MATTVITLLDGFKLGKDQIFEVELRDVTAGDVIEAQEEGEKLVMAPDGPRLVASPTRVGLGLLRRQIVRIGDVQGPISVAELKKLSQRDFNKLDAEAKLLEEATAAALTATSGSQAGDEPGR